MDARCLFVPLLSTVPLLNHPPVHLRVFVTRSATASVTVTFLEGNPPSVSVGASRVQANSDDNRIVVRAEVENNGNENVVLAWSSPDLTPEQFQQALLSAPTDLNLVRVLI